MTFVILQNILILSAALVCLIAYLTSITPTHVRTTSVILFSAAALGVMGVTICALSSEFFAASAIIFGETLVFTGILMLSFALGKSERTAAWRLCLSPLWAMLLVLSSYAVSAVHDGSAAITLSGTFCVMIMALPAACDFRRLYKRMKNDAAMLETRIMRKKMRQKKSSERKNAAAKRRKLKRGNKK